MSEPGSLPVRLAAVLGVLAAIAMFVLVTFIAPDDGPTSISLRQGLALMLVLGAPAVGALVAPEHAAALGGGMFVAGAVTMMGGNTPMLMMTAAGFLLLFAATTRSKQVTTGALIRFALVTLALVPGVYLAHGTAIITGIGAVAIATLIVLTGLPSTRASLRWSVGK